MSVFLTSSTRKFICLLCLVMFTLAFANPVLAAGYIKFEGVDGETRDTDHKGWCDLSSVSIPIALNKAISSAPRQTTLATADAEPQATITGKRQHKPLTVTKPVDKATPILRTAAKEGSVFTGATLDTVDPNDPNQAIRIVMKDVLISSYQSAGAAGGSSLPMESFSLNYGEIKITKLPKAKATR